MPMTESEIHDFSEFAQQKLRKDGTASLEDCLREWREQQVSMEDVACIRQGLAEANAGLLRDFDEVDAEVREGLKPAKDRQESHDSLTRAIADMEAGRTRSLEESAAYTHARKSAVPQMTQDELPVFRLERVVSS